MGKSAGKTILSIAGFFIGAGGWGQSVFGVAGAANASLIGGLYGAAIGSSLWTATHQEQPDTNTSYAFDQIANTVSSRDRIPIIYGTRKWGGFETYHVTNSDKTSLTKDIVWCEGDIDSISDVRANDLLINKQTQTSTVNTNLMTITYTGLSANAHYTVENNIMYLYEGGAVVSVIYFEYCNEGTVALTISDLCRYISQKDGWGASCLTPSISSKKIPSGTSENIKNTIKTITVTTTTTTVLVEGLPGCSYFTNIGAIDSSPPDNYTTTGGYRRVAWSRFSLSSSANLSGNPTLTAVIKGKKNTDTRTGAYAWSANPSMAVRDYLINKRYGTGHFVTANNIDEDSFKEIADYCDELVTTRVPTTLSTVDAVNAKIKSLQDYLALNDLSQETRDNINDEIASLQNSLINIANRPVEYTLEVTPRYELNIIINEQKSHIEILQDMLAVFGGFLVFYNNKVSLRCEMAQSSVFDFNDDNIIQDSMTHTQYPIESSPNQFNVTFYDPGNFYTGVKLVVDNTVSQKKRGKIIPKDVDLTGCTSQSQALRLARMYRDKVELSQIYVAFSTGTMAMHLEPGDVVTLSYSAYPGGVKTLLFDKIPFRINKISEDSGTYIIEAEQYNASIYNDTLGAQIQIQNSVKAPNPFNDTIPNVSKVSFSQSYYLQRDKTSVSTLTLNITIPSYVFFDCLYIYGSTNGGSSYTLLGTSDTGNFVINNAMVGKTYKFKIVVGNSAGRKSSGFITDSVFITGKDEPPNNISNFVVCEFNYWLVFSYNPPIDLDFNSVEIRYGGSSWETSKYFGNIITSPSNTINAGIPDGTTVFRAKAIDNGGNYCENEVTFVINITDVNFYKNIIFNRNDIELRDGELNGLTRLSTNELISSYSLEFDDCNTFDDLPIDYFAEWQGSIEYISPVIDTYKAGKTGINFIFDYDFYDKDPTFDSFPNRKFNDYPFDTFDHITTVTNISIWVKMSNDNQTWGEWQLYQPGQYLFRYIQYKFDGIYESQKCRAEISKLLQSYDVPDLTMSKTIIVPATGLDIVFADYGCDFYEAPKEVSPTVIGGLGNIYPDITNLTANGLTINCYDRTGTKVSGTVLLVCKGY